LKTWSSGPGFQWKINRVAFGNESVVLTHRGEPIAALVSMKELELLQKLEGQIDIDDGWKAKNEPGEPIPWEESLFAFIL